MNLARPRIFPIGLVGAIVVIELMGCARLSGQHVLYEERGIRIGVEAERFVKATVSNSHPASFTPEQMRQVLSVLEVSGYSGTLTALFVTPPPRPVFSRDELQLIAKPIAEAFRRATPSERVFFSLPDLNASYRSERTEGDLFYRAPTLFILLKEHLAFPRTDTGGGDDDRDPRDHQGLQLSVAPPVHDVRVSVEDSPHWGPYEQVHVAINVQQVFAAFAKAESAQKVVDATVGAEAARTILPIPLRKPASTESVDDLRLQIRELTNANQDLRKQLSDQTEEMETLKQALARIQQDLNQAKPKTGTRRKSPPQQ
jgi:hypothetical protein